MIYELRTYTVVPDKLPRLLDLWEHVGKPLIDRYMTCLGIWTTESGTLNQVLHLYRWENHEERDRARREFYAQPAAKDYIASVKPLYLKQVSIILAPTSFSPNFPS